jgi:hypothetical protein
MERGGGAPCEQAEFLQNQFAGEMRPLEAKASHAHTAQTWVSRANINIRNAITLKPSSKKIKQQRRWRNTK